MLAGIVEQDVGVSLLLDILGTVMSADKEAGGHPYLAVVLSFAKHFAEDVAGIVPRKHRMLLSKHDLSMPQSQVRGQQATTTSNKKQHNNNQQQMHYSNNKNKQQ